MSPHPTTHAIHEYAGRILQFESGMGEFNENLPNLTQKMN
jgi:hypothetical protein